MRPLIRCEWGEGDLLARRCGMKIFVRKKKAGFVERLLLKTLDEKKNREAKEDRVRRPDIFSVHSARIS